MPGTRLQGKLLLALTIPLGLVLLAEGTCRLWPGPEPHGAWRDPYFRPVSAEGEPLVYSNDRSIGPSVGRADVGRRWVEAEKPEGVTRVFTFGASSTQGLGFGNRASFSRFLEARLRRLSGRDVQVVNTGLSGYDSEDLPRVARETLAFEPDLWLVYAGHNELKYPNLARIQHPILSALLRRSALLKRLTPQGKEPELPGQFSGRPFLSEEDLSRAQRRYRAALEEISELARAAAVPLLLCTPASNVFDKTPRLTVLSDGEAGTAVALLGRLLRRFGPPSVAPDPAGDPLESAPEDELRAALDELEQCLATHPDAALAHFLRGRLLDRLGHSQEAFEALQRSRRLDGLPEQAPPGFGDIVRAVAAENGHPLVDVEQALRARARRADCGFDLFYDYCHPNLDGHWWIADAILQVLLEEELVGPRASFETSREPPGGLQGYLEEMGIDPHGIALGLVERGKELVGHALADPGRRQAYLAQAKEFFTGALHIDAEVREAHLGLGVVAALHGLRELARSHLALGQEKSQEQAREWAARIRATPPLLEALRAVGVEPTPDGFLLAGDRE